MRDFFQRTKVELSGADLIALAYILKKMADNITCGITEFTFGKYTVSVRYKTSMVPNSESGYLVTGIRITGQPDEAVWRDAGETVRKDEVSESERIGGSPRLRSEHRGGYPSRARTGESRTPKLYTGPGGGAKPTGPAYGQQDDPDASCPPRPDAAPESTPATGGIDFAGGPIYIPAQTLIDTNEEVLRPVYRNTLRRDAG